MTTLLDALTPDEMELRIDQAMEMRRISIQFLRSIENELIAWGTLLPEERVCVVREERRAAVDTVAQ